MPFPSQRDLPDPGIEPRSPVLKADSLPSDKPGNVTIFLVLHLFMFVILLLQIIKSKVPFNYYFKMFYGLRYLYILLVIVLSLNGVYFNIILIYLIKIIMLILYLSLTIFTTSYSEFNYGINKILNFITFSKFNTNYVVNFISGIFRFLPCFIYTEYKVLKCQASRGIDFYNSGLLPKFYAIINSFKNTFRLTILRMKFIYEEANNRLYDVKKERTNLKTGKYSFYAIMLLIFHLLFLVISIKEVIIWDIN